MSDADSLRIDPRLLESLTSIELKSRMLVRGLYNNRHRTSDFGSSNEFVEHRDYRRGDEVRTIDWRLFARTERLYVKRYEMESNMRVHFVLDTSDSMRVPPPAGLPSKLELAATIVGAVATMVITQQDAAGLYCLGDGIEERLPPKQGLNQLSEIYQHLSRPRGQKGGDFGGLLKQLTEWLGRRGVVFAVTDGLDDLERFFDALTGLCVRGHDVTLFQIFDRDELTFPYDKMTQFVHPESRQRVVCDPMMLRASYLDRLQRHVATIEDWCKKWRIDYLRLHNGEDLVKLLTSHFLKRLFSRAFRC